MILQVTYVDRWWKKALEFASKIRNNSRALCGLSTEEMLWMNYQEMRDSGLNKFCGRQFLKNLLSPLLNTLTQVAYFMLYAHKDVHV